jgi:hypothetical protein
MHEAKTYVPPLLARPVTIRTYCAGKIAKNDWRHRLFRGLRGALDCDPSQPIESPRPVDPRGKFAYAGPFFIACDHGGFHGDGTHGVGIGTDWYTPEGARRDCHDPEAYARCCPDRPSPSQERVVRLCLSCIRQSDVVFAWVDDPTAYGTVAEIGFAIGLGVPVWLYEPPQPDLVQHFDMWFMRKMATVRRIADDPIKAFEDFEKSYGPRLKSA